MWRLKSVGCLCGLVMMLFVTSLTVYAKDKETRIVVSMGDSYSAGEGIEPFYGQDDPLESKIHNVDWLAHRSQKSWSGRLLLPSVVKLSEHKDENWYFVATSGATTKHITESFEKKYNKGKKTWKFSKKGLTSEYEYSGVTNVPPQIDVFDELGKGEVDYVTLTLGGNDVGFTKIITTCVYRKIHLSDVNLKEMLDTTLDSFMAEGGARDELKAVYKLIAEEAGPQAHIIVAGYPKLLEKKKTSPIKVDDVSLVNDKVSDFNNEIKLLVEECQKEGFNISFVSVEEAFDGHGAYSKHPYLNSVMLPAQVEDIDDSVLVSAYSIHPNEKGAKAYAECVQNKINELEGIESIAYDENFGTDIRYKEQVEEITEEESHNTIETIEESSVDGITESTSLDSSGTVENKNIESISKDRSVVLTFDVSGSMNGDPLDETKRAAKRFIDSADTKDTEVGLVTYAEGIDILQDFRTGKSGLNASIDTLIAHDGTNIEDGLRGACSLLLAADSSKKILLLLSDGMPNYGLTGDELVAYADSIKDSGVYIYTLGFFDRVGKDKAEAQALMERIASSGCHYEVAEAKDIVFCFGDIADQINGQKYIYIRIACPVDVKISYDGEVLDSSEKGLSTRTSFGTLTFEEEEGSKDRIKVLRLKADTDYDVDIKGTGQGIMNYTIGFMDEDGVYSDLRRFEDIRVIRGTQISTVASSNTKDTVLNIDQDGDGKYDLKLKAGENETGTEVREVSLLLYITAVVVLVLLLCGCLYISKSKNNKGGEGQ